MTAQLYSTKSELRFWAGSNPLCDVSEICKDENLWQWSQLEIRYKRLLSVNHTTKTIHHQLKVAIRRGNKCKNVFYSNLIFNIFCVNYNVKFCYTKDLFVWNFKANFVTVTPEIHLFESCILPSLITYKVKFLNKKLCSINCGWLKETFWQYVTSHTEAFEIVVQDQQALQNSNSNNLMATRISNNKKTKTFITKKTLSWLW